MHSSLLASLNYDPYIPQCTCICTLYGMVVDYQGHASCVMSEVQMELWACDAVSPPGLAPGGGLM